MDYDQILDHIGHFGRYQLYTFLLASYSLLLVGTHMLANVFLTAAPKYRCYVDGCDSNSSRYDEDWLPFTIPHSDKPMLNYSQCEAYRHNTTACNGVEFRGVFECVDSCFTRNETSKCNEWVYDDTYYSSTVVTDWDIVCNEDWKITLTQSLFMAGVLVGAIVFGLVSDKYGRKRVFAIVPAIFLASTVGVAFVHNYVLFTILRFVTAACIAGINVTGFVYAVEFVGVKGRVWCGNLFEIFFALGELFLALLAYSIRDWNNLEIAIAAPIAILLFYPLFMPESVRWLIAQRRYDEARTIILKMASVNKKTIPDDLLKGLHLAAESHSMATIGKKATFWDLLRTPVIRKRSLNVFYNWFVNALVFYGLAMSSSFLEGSPYFTFTLLSVVEIPSVLLVTFAMQFFGRRACLSVVLLFGGVACLVTAFTPADDQTVTLILAILGKSGATMSFTVIYTYSAEVFPTVLRNTGMGASSMVARIGSILAPFIVSLGSSKAMIPMTFFGACSASAGFLALLLPETRNRLLPETVEEAEAFGKGESPTTYSGMETVGESGRF